MRIKQREVDGVVILDVSGDMHGGAENLELVGMLDRLGEGGKLDAVLNLQKVKFISSTGLGIMVRARAHYASHGGRLVVCGANARVLSLVYVTKLNLLFDMHEKCRDAVAAFA